MKIFSYKSGKFQMKQGAINFYKVRNIARANFFIVSTNRINMKRFNTYMNNKDDEERTR